MPTGSELGQCLSKGITKDDITTIDDSLTPVYTQPDKCVTTVQLQPPDNKPQVTCTATTPQLAGYGVRNAVQVTFKDMNSIGRVLDAATG